MADKIEPTFQERVHPWMLACFGAAIAADTIERNHRFLEEALELVQACGCTREEALDLVGYVYGRPVGDTEQEVGGVMVTLAALCLAQGQDMAHAGERELARISMPSVMDKIREKQAAKPKGSALPQHVASSSSVDHPAHYGGAANPYEAIKVIEAWGLGFCLGNTVKYIARSEKKGAAIEDLEKARWYLDREIASRKAVANG